MCTMTALHYVLGMEWNQVHCDNYVLEMEWNGIRVHTVKLSVCIAKHAVNLFKSHFCDPIRVIVSDAA